jgi:hypothetical protein
VRKSGSDSSGRALIAGAAILVVGGALLLVALWPSARSPRTRVGSPGQVSGVASVVTTAATAEVKTIEQPAMPKPRAGTAAPTPEPPLPPLDLFATPAPELLDMAHRIAAGGEPVALPKLKEIYEFAKDHPGDARPHLIMAEDAMNRGWYDQAIGHYVRAWKEDPRARQDERALRDLIKSAGREHSASEAGDAITEMYGRSAFDAVQAAISQAASDADEPRETRLSDLLLRLDADPAAQKK